MKDSETQGDLVPRLTKNALTVLEKRYLWKDPEGRIVESPGQLFERVARAISSFERRDRDVWFHRFYTMMASRRFLPNTPTIMNAGKEKGQLSACFVLPVEDSLDSIFESLKFAAKIHQSGGGTGFSFSRLRPKGSTVKTTHGVASGPVSFIQIYDVATETIKQGGARRGANMAVLRVDHPDILEFIESKTSKDAILNFNISVGATSEFMEALESGGNYLLRDPKTLRGIKEVPAQMIFDRMTQAAWECGDPGMVFLDRINMFNPTPKVGEIESTNPCGEQPLLPYESCNLGSLNVGEYFTEGEIQWSLLRSDIHFAVRFLDNVIDLNQFPVTESKKITLRNRKIGLGVMGFADLLLMMALPYDSEEARRLGEQLMSFIDREAKAASAGLAIERGAFPNWKGSLWERLGYRPMRNATVSTIAPTGTISIIAGASSGIEPLFSGIFVRNVLSGEKLFEIHSTVEKVFKAKGLGLKHLNENIISQALGAAWSPAQKISVDAHVKMQAVFQRHSDSAVSKTINLPESATAQDIGRAYRLAYSLGCKGITVYRDKSRPTQVLDQVTEEDLAENLCPSC